ncbi:hypothetical protein [Stutzerimonas kunmingensis]|uniref:hypothetical protein n=1 Tax=Stutzerimonas kunmingensis TaxID=1211807 RepID=UPI002FC5DDA6
MGWANCGKDSKGRPIGYAHAAKCDHPGCDADIDRGLSYACGGMHGQNEVDCEGYFCQKHLQTFVDTGEDSFTVCEACKAHLLASGEYQWDDEEGAVVPLTEAGR